MTPEEYELQVRSWLASAGSGLKSFEASHREEVKGHSGEFEIDVVARFQIFERAEVVVLVECKRHSRRVERDVMVSLLGKIRDVGAHKGMVFATCGFQSGAVQFAKENGIAAVTFTDGMFIYEALASPDMITNLHRPSDLPRFVGLFQEPSEHGTSWSAILPDRLDPLVEWFDEATKGAA